MIRLLAPPLLALGLTGCVAKTALDIAALPVKATGAAIDAATTSQAEADQKRGRRIREQEECLGKEARRAEKAGRAPDYARCEGGTRRRS